MKKIFFYCLMLIPILSACKQKALVSPGDYASLFTNMTGHHHLDSIDAEIAFWSKRFLQTEDDIVARTKIAGLHARRFAYSGNIMDVKASDSLYQLVNQFNRTHSSGTFRSLAAGCITQHQFKRAQAYIDSALALGDDKYLSLLMEFDVAMELGSKDRAISALYKLGDKNGFDYLIREAKYKDHVEGNLDEAVLLMEKALVKAKEYKQPELVLWAQSNLGDLYSHQGSFEKAYKSYLEVVKTNPEYYHAWKGIAWLAFSHDHQTAEAKRILLALKSIHPVPDYDLVLSQIADFEGNNTDRESYIDSFLTKTSNVMYGDMYNKYRFKLIADKLADAPAALALAQKETGNRPTAEAYSWLAWAYYKAGQTGKAVETAKRFVENKCFEPDALCYLGYIYLASGDREKAKKYLREANLGSVELGPNEQKAILKTLQQL